MTPASPGTSANQRPSSSRSISIEKTTSVLYHQAGCLTSEWSRRAQRSVQSVAAARGSFAGVSRSYDVKELIDTMRLSLRPFTHADVEEAFGWFGDPEVMRFTPTGPDRNQDRMRERLKQYRGHQVRHGFSKWLIQEKSSGKAIGD